MSRKRPALALVTLASLIVFATGGCLAPGHSPGLNRGEVPPDPKAEAGGTGQGLSRKVKRGEVCDLYLGPKTAKKWGYMTLTEVRKNNTDDSCDVFIAFGGGHKICSGGWIEAGESLGMNLAPEHPRENTASYRASVLDLMGETGWELVGVHKTEAGWLAWVFKQER